MLPDSIFVVVSGPPARGKSRLAARLAAWLGVPLIAEDTIEEALVAAFEPTTEHFAHRLGVAAVEAVLAASRMCPGGAVLDGNFSRSWAIDELGELPGHVVEVFCPPAREGVEQRFTQPVAGGWPVIALDTTHPVDAAEVARDVESLAAEEAARHNGEV